MNRPDALTVLNSAIIKVLAQCHAAPRDPVLNATKWDIHIESAETSSPLRLLRCTIWVPMDSMRKLRTKYCLAKLKRRPKRIISDRGTCFTSNQFENFLRSNEVQHVLNATGLPQANGQVERVNRVLRPILSKLSDSYDHDDWNLHLLDAEYALNNSKHASTKFSPSVLLFGIEQRGHLIDELTEFLDERRGSTLNDLSDIRAEASANIIKSQLTNEAYFRKNHKPAAKYEVGDYVVMRNIDSNTQQNKKLIPKYKGPYIVHKVLPNDRYVIRDIEGCPITQMPYDGILESNKLKKWSEPYETVNEI
ncbi:uncharacterized protein LOC133391922 [Anopheles gambiae]|uniref:uncharacterized protein LOC133391922 n=1 Tax=Anopheles gambiae TaxID=7165 RepID=UPI002AC9552A|nr:uncharacterized protein LOC133391922 [Anopheles gambiae]